MPETKKRIVIASVLKPVSDPRMTEKIAATLSHDDQHDVHVIGYPSVYSSPEKITFHSFAPFKRISLRRLATPFKILGLVRKLRPSILIVATHELLWIALFVKLFHRTRIVYDVQENYYLNIIHTKAFHPILKFPIALYVRLKERMAARWIDHFFLAEEIYVTQLSFARHRHTVLENKLVNSPAPSTSARVEFSLVFSGTLSRSTGVFEAIHLAKDLHKIEPRFTLTIIGHAPLVTEYKGVLSEIAGFPFIRLVGGNCHVQHQEIVKAISQAAAAIIAYEPNPASEGRIPTKLFEYIGLGVPIVFTRPFTHWVHLARKANHPCLVIDLTMPDANALLRFFSSTSNRGTFPSWVYWKSEEIKLKTAISTL